MTEEEIAMEETLYSIGEVAKLANISVQTLRYYDKIGLFKPAYTDPNTNYRYYRDSQLYHLDIIKSLKHIGTSLEDIKKAQRLKTEDLLDFLNKQERIIEKRLKKLIDIKQVLANVKVRMEKQLNDSMFGEVTIQYEEEVLILQTQARHLTPVDILNASYSELKNAVENEVGEWNNSYGAIIPFQSYKDEDEISYSYIFMPVMKHRDISLLSPNIMQTKIPAGKYVCISDRFSPEKYFDNLKKLLNYINNHHLQVIGSIYEVFTPIHYGPISQDDYLIEMKIRIDE